jgi:hypothetical protein
MYDLWYAIGYAISDQSFLGKIDASPFKRLKARIFTEVGMDASVHVIVNAKTAGLLDMNAAGNVRDTIHGALPVGHPPVSFYSAGKLCQFLTIGIIDSAKGLDFKGIIQQANGVYKAQVAENAVSAGFLALVGLSLLDTAARALLAGATAAKDKLLAEFGITVPDEKKWITNISGASDFITAQKSLTKGDGNTWDPNEGCSELFFPWDDGSAKSSRAVF